MFQKLDDFLIQYKFYRTLVGGTYVRMANHWLAVEPFYKLSDNSLMLKIGTGIIHQNFIGIESFENYQ
jgi:hypothetical protein